MDTFQRKWHISSFRSPILMLQVALESFQSWKNHLLRKNHESMWKILEISLQTTSCCKDSESAAQVAAVSILTISHSTKLQSTWNFYSTYRTQFGTKFNLMAWENSMHIMVESWLQAVSVFGGSNQASAWIFTTKRAKISLYKEHSCDLQISIFCSIE